MLGLIADHTQRQLSIGHTAGASQLPCYLLLPIVTIIINDNQRQSKTDKDSKRQTKTDKDSQRQTKTANDRLKAQTTDKDK